MVFEYNKKKEFVLFLLLFILFLISKAKRAAIKMIWLSMCVEAKKKHKIKKRNE